MHYITMVYVLKHDITMKNVHMHDITMVYVLKHDITMRNVHKCMILLWSMS